LNGLQKYCTVRSINSVGALRLQGTEPARNGQKFGQFFGRTSRRAVGAPRGPARSYIQVLILISNFWKVVATSANEGQACSVTITALAVVFDSRLLLRKTYVTFEKTTIGIHTDMV
jgi:hypothetical protein